MAETKAKTPPETPGEGEPTTLLSAATGSATANDDAGGATPKQAVSTPQGERTVVTGQNGTITVVIG